MRKYIIGAVAALAVAGGVVGYLIYRHNVDTSQAELARLNRIAIELSAHDKTIDRADVSFASTVRQAMSAAKRRHDDAVSSNRSSTFDTSQADIEKTAVGRLDSFQETVRKEQAAKVEIFTNLYGDDAVATYRDCDASEDEAVANYVLDWTSAINAIDDDDHVMANGGEHSSGVDTQAPTFYASSAKSGEAAMALQVKCTAAINVLMRRLKADIAEKKQKLGSLGVRT